MTGPMTPEREQEYRELIARTTPVGAVTAAPGLLNELLDEIDRLRSENKVLRAAQPGNARLYDTAVALQRERNALRDELAEEKASRNPLLRCLIVKAAKDRDLYVGWSNVVEAPIGVWSRETALAYGFPRSRLDRADKSGSSDLSCGDGHWDDKGFIAEQRGWLRRDRLGDYAQLYLSGHESAAFDLLEPFEGETEVRR